MNVIMSVAAWQRDTNPRGGAGRSPGARSAHILAALSAASRVPRGVPHRYVVGARVFRSRPWKTAPEHRVNVLQGDSMSKNGECLCNRRCIGQRARPCSEAASPNVDRHSAR